MSKRVLTEKRSTIIGAISIALAAVLWGMDGIVLTPRLYNLDAKFVVFITHSIPFILMSFFLYKRLKYLKYLNKSELIALFLVALFGGALGTIFIVEALFLVNFKSLSVVVLLQKLQPVFAIILAAIILKEKPHKNFLFWASIAIIAGYFLTFGLQWPHIDKDRNTITAALLAILAAFSFGSSTVFSKKILHKLDFVTATYYRYGLTAIIMFIIVSVSGHLWDFKNMTTDNWLVILIVILTSGLGAIFLYYYGLKRVKAILSTIMELFFPITAILLDYFVNGHILSPVQWISAIILIAVIIKINWDNAHAPE
jgi:drug/metabolite transporter (DMT)-like permease